MYWAVFFLSYLTNNISYLKKIMNKRLAEYVPFSLIKYHIFSLVRLLIFDQKGFVKFFIGT